MTDKEIIKALPKIWYAGHGCRKCKYSTMGGDERCGLKGCYIARHALALINRQQAEVERLVNTPPKDPMDFCGVVCNYAEELIKKAKSEARKEFAERVLRKATFMRDEETINGVVRVGDVYEILKEMG